MPVYLWYKRPRGDRGQGSLWPSHAASSPWTDVAAAACTQSHMPCTQAAAGIYVSNDVGVAAQAHTCEGRSLRVTSAEGRRTRRVWQVRTKRRRWEADCSASATLAWLSAGARGAYCNSSLCTIAASWGVSRCCAACQQVTPCGQS